MFCITPVPKIKVGNELASVENRYAFPDYKLDKEHDLALIKLSRPISSIKPAQLFDSKTEKHMITWFIGAGGTGDSGGPTYVKSEDNYQLLCISSWTDSWFYDVDEYGVTELYTLLSSYADWIKKLISTNTESERRSMSSQNRYLQTGMNADNIDSIYNSISIK